MTNTSIELEFKMEPKLQDPLNGAGHTSTEHKLIYKATLTCEKQQNEEKTELASACMVLQPLSRRPTLNMSINLRFLFERKVLLLFLEVSLQ